MSFLKTLKYRNNFLQYLSVKIKIIIHLTMKYLVLVRRRNILLIKIISDNERRKRNKVISDK